MGSCILINGTLAEPDDHWIERLGELLPGWEVLVHPPREDVVRRLDDIGIVFGSLAPELIDRAAGLQWIQLQGAGADRLLGSIRRSDVAVTNASGVHGIQITEHLLALMLAFARGIHTSVRRQRERRWAGQAEQGVFELHGREVLLIGTGAIGRRFAAAAVALGMSVVGVRRHPEQPADTMVRVVGTDSLLHELPAADFVVVTVPLTPETEGMIGDREIRAMKDGVYVFNVGRGGTICQDALIKGLRSGKVAGAGLDVFEREPLPEDSPLWDMDNVIVTAHYAGLSPRYSERLWPIFLENAARFARGEALMNVVDRELGY
jgi:phosphoglycerate dehydrogenase-like enzyme